MIARRVGAATRRQARHSTGVLYSYWENLGVDEYFWGYRPQASIGLIPNTYLPKATTVSRRWSGLVT